MDNLERALDELSAMQAMYDTDVQIDQLALECLRSAAATPPADDATELPELQYTLRVPLPDSEGSSEPCELRVACPYGYPGGEEILRCSCSAPGISRKRNENLNEALCQFLSDMGPGSEAVMAAAMWLSEAASRELAEAQEEVASTQSRGPLEEEDLWVRCCLWAEMLFEGRTHKPAAKTLALACSGDLTGLFFYGRPGIIIAEGRQRDVDELIKEARRTAGKTLRLKKTQALAEGAASRHYSKMSTRSALPGDSLDVDALQAEFGQLGLTHKYRFIIGLEDAQH